MRNAHVTKNSECLLRSFVADLASKTQTMTFCLDDQTSYIILNLWTNTHGFPVTDVIKYELLRVIFNRLRGLYGDCFFPEDILLHPKSKHYFEYLDLINLVCFLLVIPEQTGFRCNFWSNLQIFTKVSLVHLR